MIVLKEKLKRLKQGIEVYGKSLNVRMKLREKLVQEWDNFVGFKK